MHKLFLRFIHFRGATLNHTLVFLKPDFPEVATVNPSNITLDSSKKGVLIHICAQEAGYSVITATISGEEEYIFFFTFRASGEESRFIEWRKMFSDIS